ncbi:MAG TPA: hypothetical protein VJ696_02500 [Rhodanobacteraceae bacterium]|nr:hypothetical protein [Rhodanobacteraceae bacterium]
MSTSLVFQSLAMSLPIGFAVAAALLEHRKTSHPLLFFVVAVFTFCWIGDAAFDQIYGHMAPSEPPHDMDSLMHATTLAWLVADAIAGVVGGFVVWRLALALRKPGSSA